MIPLHQVISLHPTVGGIQTFLADQIVVAVDQGLVVLVEGHLGQQMQTQILEVVTLFHGLMVAMVLHLMEVVVKLVDLVPKS